MGTITGDEAGTHPFVVLSEEGDAIARLNADVTWSVKWDAVTDQAYREENSRNRHLRAFCRVLVAGRDNFRTSPWNHPSRWDHMPFQLAPFETSAKLSLLAIVGLDSGIIALLTPEATWQIDWARAYEGRVVEPGAWWGAVPVAGVCEALIGGRDNFPAQPLPEDEDGG